MIIGGSGGTKIPTAVAQGKTSHLCTHRSLYHRVMSCAAIMKTMSFEEGIADAIEAKRLHHQLIPIYIQYEREFLINSTYRDYSEPQDTLSNRGTHHLGL